MKKSILTFIGALMAMLYIAGCTTPMNTDKATDLLASTVNLKYYMDNDRIVDIIDNANLTEEETAVLVAALAKVDTADKLLREIEQDPIKLVTKLDTIALGYTNIKAAYLDVKEVVLAHKDEYSEVELRAFSQFDDAAKVLDVQFTEFVVGLRPVEAVTTASKLADTAFKLAAVL